MLPVFFLLVPPPPPWFRPRITKPQVKTLLSNLLKGYTPLYQIPGKAGGLWRMQKVHIKRQTYLQHLREGGWDIGAGMLRLWDKGKKCGEEGDFYGPGCVATIIVCCVAHFRVQGSVEHCVRAFRKFDLLSWLWGLLSGDSHLTIVAKLRKRRTNRRPSFRSRPQAVLN